MNDPIKITINDEPKQIPEGTNIAALVPLLSLPNTGLAIAINGEVVQRSKWPEKKLTANDSVLVITATQGG